MEEREIEKLQWTLIKAAEIVHREELRKLNEAIRRVDEAQRFSDLP